MSFKEVSFKEVSFKEVSFKKAEIRSLLLVPALCCSLLACSTSYEKKPDSPVNRVAKGAVSGVKTVTTGAVDVTGAVVGGVAQGTERAISGETGAVSGGINSAFDTTSDAVGGAFDSTSQSPISDKARARMTGGINCSTARSDIAVLEQERSSTLKQMSSGVGSVLPMAAAVRVLSGSYRDGVSVATGEYNRDLDDRIGKIKRTCGIR